MKTKSVITTSIVVACLLFVGIWSFVRAQNAGVLTACVNRTGTMRILDTSKPTNKCLRGENQISWNIQGLTGLQGPQGEQGLKGDKGEDGEKGDTGAQGLQGEQGLPAQHGAGNIAFVYGNYVLKTDGTIWIVNSGNIPFSQIEGNPGQTPIPVSDIVAWTRNSLIDKDGNLWYIELGRPQEGWHNFGPIP